LPPSVSPPHHLRTRPHAPLSLWQVIHLKAIARRVRSKCRLRRESLVLNLKKDLNRLASSLLSELTAASPDRKFALQKLKSSEGKGDEGDDDSLCSDPLGGLATVFLSLPSSWAGDIASKEIRVPSTTPNHDIPLAVAPRPLDISRFSKLDVLNSIRGAF
jgi:hypothetical protein